MQIWPLQIFTHVIIIIFNLQPVFTGPSVVRFLYQPKPGQSYIDVETWITVADEDLGSFGLQDVVVVDDEEGLNIQLVKYALYGPVSPAAWVQQFKFPKVCTYIILQEFSRSLINLWRTQHKVTRFMNSVPIKQWEFCRYGIVFRIPTNIPIERMYNRIIYLAAVDGESGTVFPAQLKPYPQIL